MEMQPVQEPLLDTQQVKSAVGVVRTTIACIAGYFVPGLGHALLGKWDRAVVFFVSIAAMLVLGIRLQGRLFGPELGDFFSTLKFVADAGAGLLYWIPWFRGIGVGDPTAYTYDYANVFIYVAGLLNMLVIVDAFDIALGRKK
jgi:hypothetical protein